MSHNWNAENEAAAMRIFRDKFVELGGEWADTAFPDTQASITSVKARFIGGNPPMALQSALGGVMQEFAAAGMLQNMDDAAAAGGWGDNITESIAAVAKHDGHWVAAPAFVDVINWMYTNNEVLAAAGVAAPNTWEEFKASLPVLQEAGSIPLAVGGQSWQEGILFDHVVLAVGGAALYDGMMSGNADVVSGPQTRQALKNSPACASTPMKESPAGAGRTPTTSLLRDRRRISSWAPGPGAAMGTSEPKAEPGPAG